MLRTLFLALSLTACIVFAAACGEEHAEMRFVHAVSDTGAVDVAVNGHTVVTNQAFATSSPGYASVTAGNRLVEVRPTGTTTDLVSAPSVPLSSHKQFTLFFEGLTSDHTQSIVLVTDDNSAPSNGGVKFRVMNAACKAIATDACLGSPAPFRADIYIVSPGTDISSLSPAIPGLAYQQASSYLNLSPASYEVIVTDPADATKTPKVDETYNLAAGQVRTFTILSNTDGTISTTPLFLLDVH